MSATNLNNRWRDSILNSCNEQSIFLPKSLKAWQDKMRVNVLTKGFPTSRLEDWKYTDVAHILQTKYDFVSQTQSSPIKHTKIKDSYSVVLTNGRLQKRSNQQLPDGMIIADMMDVLREEKWQSYLSVDNRYETFFSELNATLMSGGLFIYIPKNLIIEKPIHICNQTIATKPLMNHVRHMIIADTNSQCCIVEEYIGQGNNYFNNIVTHVNAEQAATITHFKLQNEEQPSTHIANTVFTLAKDSLISSLVLSLGATLNRENQNFHLNQQGASAHLYGLYLPFLNQHIDHHTRIDHLSPHCFSQQTYKGVIGEKGRAVFNGKVIVHQGAQKTAAYQTNQNLLLGKSAEINTKPELEIYADDIKCTHGATVGQLDKKALFYLRSRGINQTQSKRILTRAFAQELLKNITNPAIENYLQSILENKLTSLIR